MPTLMVGPTSTFPSIAAAIAAPAGPGDNILLEAGYSNETATVNVNNLSFTGGPTSTNIILQLGSGIVTTTLLGSAPIEVRDGPDANSIVGNDGANTFRVSSGVDNVSGGGGIDRLVIDYAAATGPITGTVTTVTDGGTHAVIFDGVENFTITTGSGNDTITVADGANVINTSLGNDTITVGNGANVVNGDGGNDTITVGNGANVVDGGDGNDTIITGNGGDTVLGGLGDDGITTGSGNDVVDAGLGNDTVITGAGSDRITVNGGIDTVDSGSEADRLIIDYSGSTTAVTGGVTGGTLAAGYSGMIADGAGTSSVNFLGTEAFTVFTGTGNDSITTGDGADVISSGVGNDTLRGGLGNDTLRGGAGADSLDGGAGIDTVSYADATAGVRVHLGDPGTNTGDAAGDTYVDVEVLEGSAFDDVLIGDAAANQLLGGGGSDQIVGGAGADTMEGGAGDDYYYVGNAGQVVTEAVDAGLDRVFATISYTLSANVEALFLQGPAANGVGNGLDNTIVGNALTNVLEGGDGSDYLVDGGGGLDTLTGGIGDDFYFLSVSGVTINENADQGFDRIFATVSTVMADNVEALILQGADVISGIGNASDNSILGNGAGNVLSGGAGNDLLYGRGGNDTFVFRAGYGADIVADFEGAGAAGGDALQIDPSLVANFAALQALGSQNGADATYTFAGGTTLTLWNVNFAGLIASDVVFG